MAPETEVFVDPEDASVVMAQPTRAGFCGMCAQGQHFHQPVSPLVSSGRCQNVASFDDEGSPVLCDCLVVLGVPATPGVTGVTVTPPPVTGTALVLVGEA